MHWVYDRVLPHADKKDAGGIARSLIGLLMREMTPDANLGDICNRTVFSAFHTPSRAARHYEQLKRASNENAQAMLPAAREYVAAGRTPRIRFERACFLAAASNVAPLNSPSGAYTFDEVGSIMDKGGSKPVFMGDVYSAASKAKHILYITDNAGEIGFDRLVVDAISQMGPKVTLVAKTKTFFEDATLDDARFFHFDDAVDGLVTADGFFAPSALPETLRDVLNGCDLVIGKGTGSYEALQGEESAKPVVFMLKVKCAPIARQTAARMGEVVIKLER